MFAPRWLLDKLIETQKELTEQALSSYIESFKLALSAKETEVAFLKRQIADLQQSIRYESKRADALVDRLLIRDAKVFPVQPLAEEQAKKEQEAVFAKLQEVMDEVNMTGEDVPEIPAAPQQTTFAGGAEGIRESVTRASA